MTVVRCAWAGHPDLRDYHDEEWGVPVHEESRLFELLSLEGAQAGLSWLTVLRRRDGYRAAFAGFDPDVVARFTPQDVDRLLSDPGIIRHRGKVESVVANAAAVVALRESGRTLDGLLWGAVHGRPRTRDGPPSPSLVDTGVGRAESGAEAPGVPVRGPDDVLLADAGGGPRQRPRPHLLPPRRTGRRSVAALTRRSGARGPRIGSGTRTGGQLMVTTSDCLTTTLPSVASRCTVAVVSPAAGVPDSVAVPFGPGVKVRPASVRGTTAFTLVVLRAGAVVTAKEPGVPVVKLTPSDDVMPNTDSVNAWAAPGPSPLSATRVKVYTPGVGSPPSRAVPLPPGPSRSEAGRLGDEMVATGLPWDFTVNLRVLP